MYETVEDALASLEGSGARIADGFDDCIIGIASRCGQPDLVVYDSVKIVDKLVLRDGMSYEDAVEFYEYNILGAWVGEGTPLYITPIQTQPDDQN